MSNVKFLPKVLEYDRYQPEFYEDTITYITKRTSKNKIKSGIDLYNENILFTGAVSFDKYRSIDNGVMCGNYLEYCKKK